MGDTSWFQHAGVRRLNLCLRNKQLPYCMMQNNQLCTVGPRGTVSSISNLTPLPSGKDFGRCVTRKRTSHRSYFVLSGQTGTLCSLPSALGAAFPRYGLHRKRTEESSENYQKSRSMRINWINRDVWARKDTAEGNVQQSSYAWKPPVEHKENPILQGYGCSTEGRGTLLLLGKPGRAAKLLKELFGDTVKTFHDRDGKDKSNHLSEMQFPSNPASGKQSGLESTFSPEYNSEKQESKAVVVLQNVTTRIWKWSGLSFVVLRCSTQAEKLRWLLLSSSTDWWGMPRLFITAATGKPGLPVPTTSEQDQEEGTLPWLCLVGGLPKCSLSWQTASAPTTAAFFLMSTNSQPSPLTAWWSSLCCLIIHSLPYRHNIPKYSVFAPFIPQHL